MFEVNDIPPIDGWELQQLIAENVQHEEFLFFRFYAGDEQDYFGPDSYTKRYECFCTACRERFTEPHSAGPASKWRIWHLFAPIAAQGRELETPIAPTAAMR